MMQCARVVAVVLVIGACQLDPVGVDPPATESEEGSGNQGTATDTPADSDSGNDAASGPITEMSTGPVATGTSATGTSATTGPDPTTGEMMDGSSEETGDPPPAEMEPYGACGPGGACNGNSQCYTFDRSDMCLPPCPDGTNLTCPPAPEGTFAECVEVLGTSCMLNCAMDGCPEGTECIEVFQDVFRCLWPQDA